MNEGTKEVFNVSALGVDVAINTGAAALTAEELISTLAPDDAIAEGLCEIARAASTMVDEVFPGADIDTQLLKLAEECDEMYFSGCTYSGLVDIAIVSLQLLYDYKCMIGLCTLRGALQESVIRTEEDWKDFIDACYCKIKMNYTRKAKGFWEEARTIPVPMYGRSDGE
jgi:hypothetical protein